MITREQLEEERGDAAGLERLYRQALATAGEPSFREQLARSAQAHPEDTLLKAWTYRLDLRPLPATPTQSASNPQTRYWALALAGSAAMGLLALLCAGNRPPIPVPQVASPFFWIGWAPLTGLGLLAYLALQGSAVRPAQRLGRCGLPGLFIALIAWYAALAFWDRTDQLAELIALHLPFVAWAAVAAGVSLSHADAQEQLHAFTVKSVEILITAGLYFGTWMAFVGLTCGIFAVLGFKPPPELIHALAAWGTGAVPLLALASVTDPSRTPAAQRWDTGLARLLRILTRIFLPLALAVLAVYVCWFIPAYFWRPFQEREVLIVYNATTLAILALMTAALADPGETRSPAQDTALRWQLLALAGLTLVLNLYALAAILSRTLNYGLTPNRYAVLGWNLVTLLMLGTVLAGQWRTRGKDWSGVWRSTLGQGAALAALWALWVIVGLPWTL